VLSWPTDPRLVEAICRLLDNPDVRDSVAEILGGLNLYPKVQAKLLSYLDSHPDALVSGVNGHVAVPAGGQLKVPTPR
jgi:hypothetical protein